MADQEKNKRRKITIFFLNASYESKLTKVVKLIERWVVDGLKL